MSNYENKWFYYAIVSDGSVGYRICKGKHPLQAETFEGQIIIFWTEIPEDLAKETVERENRLQSVENRKRLLKNDL